MKRAILNVLIAGMMMLISVLGVSAADLDITLTPAEYFLEKDETKIIEDATKIGYNFSGWVIE